MATFDLNVLVTVTTDAPSGDVAGFNLPLFVGVMKDFLPNEVRFYESATDVADDSADLGPVPKAALDAGYAQSPNAKRMGAGAVTPSTKQKVVWTYADGGAGATAGDKFSITINGIETEITAVGAEDEAAIALALRTALIAALAAEPVTVDPAVGAAIDIEADSNNDVFLYTEDETVAGQVALSTRVVTEATVAWSTELDAMLANDDTWYAFTIDSHAKADILAAAAWAETNKKLFLGQTSDADALTGPNDVLEDLNDLSYLQSGCCWHSRNDRFFAFSWIAKTLAADPDEKTTIWAYKTIAGIESDKDNVSTTEKTYILSKEGNVYLPFFGTPVAGMGRVAIGHPIDIIITLNWTEARVAEAIAQLFVDASNRNEKVPFTDVGITMVQAVVEDVMKTGERVEHFTPESTVVTVPALDEVLPADKAARLLRLSFTGELAGAIEKATVNGSLVVSL